MHASEKLWEDGRVTATIWDGWGYLRLLGLWGYYHWMKPRLLGMARATKEALLACLVLPLAALRSLFWRP